jgi:hypothetical protein
VTFPDFSFFLSDRAQPVRLQGMNLQTGNSQYGRRAMLPMPIGYAWPGAVDVRLMQVFMNIDRIIGKDFEIGLANLKRLAENQPTIRSIITRGARDAGQSLSVLQWQLRSGVQVLRQGAWRRDRRHADA